MPKSEFVNSRSSSTGVAQDLPQSFVFVPVTSNEAAQRRGAAKSLVRAHVTRLQHARSAASKAHTILHWTVVTEDPSRADGPSTSRSSVENSSHSPETATEEDVSDGEPRRDPLELLIPAVPSGASAEDPFWTYPVEYHPALSPIFSHYLHNIAVDIPDLDGPNDKGLMRKKWFPLAMTEAAPMYAVLLMAASHYSAILPSGNAGINLLDLKARALNEINTALSSPDRALSDAMVGAVAKMTAYEALFGEFSSYTAHREGLQNMIKLRGGLQTLGLDGLLERMLVWIDLNSSHLKGVGVVFDGTQFPTSVWFPAPDLPHFAGIEE